MTVKNSKGDIIPRSRTKMGRHMLKEQQNALRERVKGKQHMNQIGKIVGTLQDLDVELDSTQVSRLKIAMDGHFKILAKILPDIKSTEINVSGEIQHKALGELSNEDLAQIIEGDCKDITNDGQ